MVSLNRYHVVRFLLLLMLGFDCFACKNPDFDALMKMNKKQLSEFGCSRYHIKLQLMSRDGKYFEVIKIAEKLNIKGLLDGPSLRAEAYAYYKLGLYSDALEAHLMSKNTPAQCETYLSCRWEYTEATEHYESSYYYQANGNIREAEEELKSGDASFFITCKSQPGDSYCLKMRGRLIKMLNSEFDYSESPVTH